MSDDADLNIEESIVFVGVEEKNVGHIAIDFDSGDRFSGNAVVLTINVVDINTTKKRTIDFVIPSTMGPELLVNLLTDDQWDAVCNV